MALWLLVLSNTSSMSPGWPCHLDWNTSTNTGLSFLKSYFIHSAKRARPSFFDDTLVIQTHPLVRGSIHRLTFYLNKYFGLCLNTCKTNNISCDSCLVPIRKCEHVTMLNFIFFLGTNYCKYARISQHTSFHPLYLARFEMICLKSIRFKTIFMM